MTREEAVKIINCYDMGFYDLNGEKIPADKLADAFDMAIEALQAEPNRPQGEWIDIYGEPYSMCSNCERYIDDIDDDFEFCPHCGAKMDKE